jgi:hypothetical protein
VRVALAQAVDQFEADMRRTRYFGSATHRLRLRFVQKLSVRHVSIPLDSAGRHSLISFWR